MTVAKTYIYLEPKGKKRNTGLVILLHNGMSTYFFQEEEEAGGWMDGRGEVRTKSI